jgi:BlaI family transcriptional regulator, penicillinase repressor
MKSIPPSNLEMQILALLWQQGPLPVREVRALLPDGKKRAYTSVLSVMQVMEKKGLLTHETDGNRHLYRPAVKQRQIFRPFLQSLISNFFGGSAPAAMQHLLQNTDVSAAELSEMRKVLDQFAEEKSNGKGKKS